LTIIELNHEECLNSACFKSGQNLKIWNGPMEEAQQRLQTTLEQVPNFSLEFAKEKMFYMKKQDQVDLYLKGLQSAGAGP
jgi:hypothetical protein